jgi:hypothetical protein
VKISLLRNGGRSATTATLVDTGVYWFSSGIVGLTGCLTAALLFVHSGHSIAPVAMVGVILLFALFLIGRPKSRLSPLVDALDARCPRWLEKGKQIEVAIRQFESRCPSSIRSMLLLDVACQVLLAAEVVVIFWCLKIPLHAATVLGVEGATRAIKLMAGWMPARIGADESGVAGAFVAFGLSPASGLTLALARRSRDLLAALIGLSWLALRSEFLRCAPAGIPKTAYWKEEKTTCKLC